MAEDTLILLGLFSLLGWSFWLIARTRQRMQQRKIDFRAQVLARFESIDDLKEFLHSDAGRAFLGNSLSRIPLSRIMMACQLGVFLSMVGLGILALALVIVRREIMIPGILFLCGGVGFLAAAFFSYWFLKRHGLLETGGTRNKQEFEP